jgi:DNA polymerase III sliding clamp (beta) subunit (PCNA family)
LQTVQRNQLLQDLASVNAGVASKELLEQSNSFIFKNNTICAFNDEVFATTKTEVDFEGAVEATLLLQLLNKIKDTEIQIDTEDDELRIKGKKFDSGIKYDPEIRLPLDEVTMPKDKSFKKVSENFAQHVKLACLTASKSLSDPILSCVHFRKDKVESCDNGRITICDLDTNLKFKALVPASTLLTIIKHKIKAVAKDDTWMHFKTEDDVIISCRLYNETYIDLDEHIPEDKGEEIELPAELNDILGRADIFGKDIVTQEKMIDVSIKKKKLVIEAKNESGWYKERATTKYKGPDISFSINSDFLKDVLSLSNKISIIDNLLVFSDQNSIHLVLLDS